MKKNFFKVIGIIAIVAIIGFGIVACDGDGDTVDVTGVTLNKTTATIAVGATEKLTATVAPDDATDKTVTWSSNDTSIATVSDGTVTAVKVGTAKITVKTTDGEKTADCVVTVTSSDPEKLRLTNVPVTYTDYTAETNFGYHWESSAEPLSNFITGTPKVQIAAGGAGGTLTLELDKPKDAVLWGLSGELGSSFTVTPDTTEAYSFNNFTISDGSYVLYMKGPGTSVTHLYYFTNDVTINGTGDGMSFDNVKFKKGWNFVSMTDDDPNVFTASQTQPAGAVWTVSED